jgi:hypothetical protein
VFSKNPIKEEIVKKKSLVSVVASLAALALIAAAALALVPRNDIVVSPDGRKMIALKGPSHITLPDISADAGLKTIGGNLSDYPHGTFFCCFGNTIAQGPPSFLFTYWVAIAFTPTADATVTRVEVPVGTYNTKVIDFLVNLDEDASGVPGKSLKTWHAKAPNVYGSCCTLDVVNDKAGIPVKAGTQYWVAVTTNSKSDFFGGWPFNSTDMRAHLIAGYCKGDTKYCGTTDNGKWVAGNAIPTVAFAVLGH